VWVTSGGRCRVNQENPPMRIYIIGNDGIALCREAPATVNDGEVGGGRDRGECRLSEQRTRSELGQDFRRRH
jgi:hypothetical protein